MNLNPMLPLFDVIYKDAKDNIRTAVLPAVDRDDAVRVAHELIHEPMILSVTYTSDCSK